MKNQRIESFTACGQTFENRLLDVGEDRDRVTQWVHARYLEEHEHVIQCESDDHPDAPFWTVWRLGGGVRYARIEAILVPYTPGVLVQNDPRTVTASCIATAYETAGCSRRMARVFAEWVKSGINPGDRVEASYGLPH